MPDARRASISVEVRYAETDQMGIVHHANYLVWFELARTALCRLSGYAYSEIEKAGYLLVVTGAELKYRKPARYEETLDVSAWIERLASRSIRFRYEVRRRGELLVTGSTEHVWTRRETGTICRTPDLVAEEFRRLAGAE